MDRRCFMSFNCSLSNLKLYLIITIFLFISSCHSVKKDENKTQGNWHNIERTQRYFPDGNDFVIKNGERRFNRALYGGNSGFRVEAGDLPEFALYLPGMGGNFRFGLLTEKSDKWLIDSEEIIARYRPGSMIYDIKDPSSGDWVMHLSVLPMYTADGMIIRATFNNINENLDLLWTFGGVTGKRFNRDGDIGADPESVFYLQPEYCEGNEFIQNDNSFDVYYGTGRILTETERYENNYKASNSGLESTLLKNKKRLCGIVPPGSKIKICDANKLSLPLTLFESSPSKNPVISGKQSVNTKDTLYFIVYNPENQRNIAYNDAKRLFEQAEAERKSIAERITVRTPDQYINTLGQALSIAADAIWESPSYLHGAVAWRMRLNGWRGEYAADWLGWHDRARTHLSGYALAQYTSPEPGASSDPDPEKNLARQKEVAGKSIYTSGYISRNPGKISPPHHYDMNLIYIDQLLRHFKWTGDTSFLKEIWPVIERHLDWETTTFDGDKDNLYDAYCLIWASDALQYKGGGVSYSSAYNYKAYKDAARLAKKIGIDPSPFSLKAEKIRKALNSILWMPGKGWYAEYKDLLGAQKLHPSTGLWGIYHLIDAEVPDPFQCYQMLRYVDNYIPHIPVKAKGLGDKDYYTLSTTNWQPYTWSVNNVALAEVLHTSLAYWQSGRSDEAFRLWKSALLESMYLGASPGNFQQLSFYDAMRGELYRDFADPVGIAARSLVEGLFGITPDAVNGTLNVKPGFPASWDSAYLTTPDIEFKYSGNNQQENYIISNRLPGPLKLSLIINASYDKIEKVAVNGKSTPWTNLINAIDNPFIEIGAAPEAHYNVEITWSGKSPGKLLYDNEIASGDEIDIRSGGMKITDIYDPQDALDDISITSDEIKARVNTDKGFKTVFVYVNQGDLKWWEPVCFTVFDPLEIVSPLEQPNDSLVFSIKNYTHSTVEARLTINPPNGAFSKNLRLKPGAINKIVISNPAFLKPGTNLVVLDRADSKSLGKTVINWDIRSTSNGNDPRDISSYYNDRITNIFKNQYLSPRSPYPALQLPIQGLGDWCSFDAKMEIDDSGLRRLTGEKNEILFPQGIPFNCPGSPDDKNIIFTSLWDNYPDSVNIPLSGKASHAYFLVTGTTNPMQSRFENGSIEIVYTDGSSALLSLVNPETWWPIEQDYYRDNYAFAIDAPKPYRLHLKTGIITKDFKEYISIGGFTKFAIEGGASTLLDLPLDISKSLQECRIKATANDVIIGLISLTLDRK